MVGGVRPLLPEILGQTDPPGFKNSDFHSIFARSGSTVGASEKSSIMTIKSSVGAFQGAFVAHKPPKGCLKGDNFVISVSKNGLRWTKVCCKVCLCENFLRHSCKAFTGLSIWAEMVGGRCPLLREILGQSDPASCKNGDFLSIFACSDCTVTKTK